MIYKVTKTRVLEFDFYNFMNITLKNVKNVK